MGSSVHCPIHLHTRPGTTVYTALSVEIIYRAKVQDYLSNIKINTILPLEAILPSDNRDWINFNGMSHM